MKKLMLLIAFLLTTSSIAQDNLIKISTTTEGTYYLIKSTVRMSTQGDSNNTYIECWFKVIYNKDQIINEQKYSNVISMNKVIINCYGNQFKLLETIFYDNNGKILKNSKFNELDPFTNAPPETLGWKIIEISCLFKE